jgi:type II restriction enzyme
MKKVKTTKVDLFLKNEDEFFLFDIKTAKPNMGAFREFKQTLLEWTAIILANNPNAKVNTLIAIPYNPYGSQPYNRWTMAGMLDLKNELMVAEEFWNFLSKDSYKGLLKCFEEVGIEMREEIDDYFLKFTRTP